MTGSAAPRTPRPRDAGATRADLLRAAKRRFATLGYDRTTSRDIAADAGVNVSLIYRYFGSKEELFEVALQDSAGLLEELRGVALADFIDGVLAGLEPGAYPEYGSEHPLAMLLRDVGDDGRAKELRSRTFGAMLSYLAEQVDQPDPSGSPRTRAGLLLAMLLGLVTVRTVVPDDPFAHTGIDDLRTELYRIADVLATGR